MRVAVPEGGLVLPELCGHVMFPGGTPISVEPVSSTETKAVSPIAPLLTIQLTHRHNLTIPAIYPIMHCTDADPKVEKGAKHFLLLCLKSLSLL